MSAILRNCRVCPPCQKKVHFPSRRSLAREVACICGVGFSLPEARAGNWIKQVKFFIKSFGVKNMKHLGWPHRICSREQKCAVVGDDDAILIDLLDCPRLFDDPEKCVGTHIDCVRNMVEDPASAAFLKKTLDKLCRELDRNFRTFLVKGSCTLAVFCSWGKHRSVCWAWLLAEVLVSWEASVKLTNLCQGLEPLLSDGLSIITHPQRLQRGRNQQREQPWRQQHNDNENHKNTENVNIAIETASRHSLAQH